ncbi:MAG TPA: hypothetical protein VGB46_02045 [Flavisolibacter sp.]
MEQTIFHKQKLYALIAAGVALVALLLPWISFMGYSWNGMRGWGLLSLAGIIGVAALTLMGNKTLDYTADYRKYVMISFGAIALGAILFWVRKNSIAGGGVPEIFEVKLSTGIGLWLCLVAGLGGLALAFGLIKLDKKPL